MKFSKLFWFSSGPIVNSALGLITVPLIVHFFSQEDVARFSLFNTVLALSLSVFSLGLDQYFIRHYYDSKFRNSLILRVIIPGLSLFFLFFLFVMSNEWDLSYILFSIDSTSISNLAMLIVVVSLFNRFVILTHRMSGQGKEYSIFLVLPKLFFIAFLTFFSYEGISFYDLALYLFLSSFIVLILNVINLRKQLIDGVRTFRLSSKELKYKDMFFYGLPLVPSSLAFWALTGSDKFIIKYLVGLEELAFYSVAVSFAGVGVVLQNVFSNLWSPFVYSTISKNGDLSVVWHCNRVLLILVCVISFISTSLSRLLGYVLPENYEPVQYIFTACMLYPLLYTLTESTSIGIGVKKKTNYALFCTLVTLIVNVGLNFIVVPFLGYKGAAITTAFSFFVYFLIRTSISNKIWINQVGVYFYFQAFLLVVFSIMNCFFLEGFYIYVVLLWACLTGLVVFSNVGSLSFILHKSYRKNNQI
ncbi:oligosaccharide flippase family protein [Vibrio parahaemolyticus]|uniref:oligosaccharide flippase family protein n=1 Tax=Vibrio parahaemolyticus TaxID=670 RepID=UPI00215B7F60|nr:oligosaccharide flippase family protein [Vibrio parahaemolyticus]MCS0049299.1 oligosaccharide flippase family protein [Vibrio parahaemolyticus]